MKALDIAAAILLVVGGLNWGLVGTANFDLVAALFGAGSSDLLGVTLSAMRSNLNFPALERETS